MNSASPTASRSLVLESPLGPGLRYGRTLSASPEAVWDACSTPDGLPAWIGELRQANHAHQLQFSMNAEGGEPQWTDVTVRRCEAPRAWTVELDAGMGAWRFTLDLSPAADGTTALVFEHHMDAVADLVPYGTGWDYYLDRLELVLAGESPAAVDWEETNARLSPAFAALFAPHLAVQADGADDAAGTDEAL